ncbi:Hypothetical predicted protein [Pelobates cultripes]|uniref:Uncharacterized protein n=1 Tax=Pelobates cultripes TaxID=61616 RepID=A0AAD1SCM9_PELCU|nr:Hypothetical predicted protein [Pelobates cultripes]
MGDTAGVPACLRTGFYFVVKPDTVKKQALFLSTCSATGRDVIIEKRQRVVQIDPLVMSEPFLSAFNAGSAAEQMDSAIRSSKANAKQDVNGSMIPVFMPLTEHSWH